MLMDERRLLGHHAPQGHSSTLIYSRDAMAGPLRSFQDIQAQIREGSFLPDTTRSGMIKKHGFYGPSAKDLVEADEV